MKKKDKNLLKTFGMVVLLLFLMGVALFFVFLKDLPRPEVFTEAQMNQSTKIYDRTGKILLSSVYGEEKRTYIPLSQIPDIMKKAVIATEDSNFYHHFGIDIPAIFRALKIDITKRTNTHGASTITQQLIRSTFLTTDKTISRKVKEAVLSIELDRKYSKDQILEWYLNQVPFGINIYGIEEASLSYFQKPAQDLTLPEAALLAAIIQLPSYYSPYGSHLDQLLIRKDYVLDRMAQEHYITEQERDEAKKVKLSFNKLPKTTAVHFVEYVKKQLEETYGPEFLEIKGLKIYTTLDWELQQTAEAAIAENVENNIARFGAYNSALVSIDPHTGEILAMVGSANPWGDPLPKGCDPSTNCKFVPSFNVATDGLGRQPGSSFKPFVYAEAFRKGATPDTVVVDELTDFGVWGTEHYIPQNYDGRFRGPVSLRNALAQSLNVPAVKVLRDLAGLDDSITLAKKLGITTLTQPSGYYGLALVLGGGEVHLLDMVSAYGVFGNDGYRIEPSPIIKIEDANGNIVYENKKSPRKVLESSVCDMITDVLSDNNARAPIFGPYSNLRFDNYKVYVKTGTTQKNGDGWVIGCTEDTCVGVWSGNNDNTRMTGGVGESASGPAWRKVIEKSVELKQKSAE
ncbi:MAG: PBP1A family penicillin-binding protein [Candidatus Pacebacteria bacterium]|nr:PBP1A family penicillin-binding protein [Candidatus Paceibacterota bacterium]